MLRNQPYNPTLFHYVSSFNVFVLKVETRFERSEIDTKTHLIEATRLPLSSINDSKGEV